MQKRSAFHWIIATNQIKLWNGSGTVPGTHNNAHSRWAESYRLITALIFLEKYLTATQANPPPNSTPIKGNCDNLGVIQQVSYLQEWQIPNPNDTITNNYDLAQEIFTATQCTPIQITLHHIKGHQDEKQPITKLPHEAQLNIICNEKACEALENYPENLSPHPTLPASYPHLKIKWQTIIQRYQEYLCKATQLPTYHKYLHQKFLWNQHIVHMIEWRLIKYTMWKFSSNQIRIRKMIHEWTPTRISPGSSPTIIMDTLCPTCRLHPETPPPLTPMWSPLPQQNLPNPTAPVKQTLFQIQSWPTPLSDVLVGTTEYPRQPDPAHHWYVPPPHSMTYFWANQRSDGNSYTMVNYQNTGPTTCHRTTLKSTPQLSVPKF